MTVRPIRFTRGHIEISGDPPWPVRSLEPYQQDRCPGFFVLFTKDSDRTKARPRPPVRYPRRCASDWADGPGGRPCMMTGPIGGSQRRHSE